MITFDSDLRAVDGLIDNGILNRNILTQTSPFHKFTHPVAAKTPHDIIFERNIKTGTSRVSLTPGPAS